MITQSTNYACIPRTHSARLTHPSCVLLAYVLTYLSRLLDPARPHPQMCQIIAYINIDIYVTIQLSHHVIYTYIQYAEVAHADTSCGFYIISYSVNLNIPVVYD